MNGTLQLILRKDLPLEAPLAETPTDFITMGFAEDLDAAFEIALRRMIDFLHRFVGIGRSAMGSAGVAGSCIGQTQSVRS
jgi:acetamidase/formamidase